MGQPHEHYHARQAQRRVVVWGCKEHSTPAGETCQGCLYEPVTQQPPTALLRRPSRFNEQNAYSDNNIMTALTGELTPTPGP